MQTSSTLIITLLTPLSDYAINNISSTPHSHTPSSHYPHHLSLFTDNSPSHYIYEPYTITSHLSPSGNLIASIKSTSLIFIYDLIVMWLTSCVISVVETSPLHFVNGFTFMKILILGFILVSWFVSIIMMIYLFMICGFFIN